MLPGRLEPATLLIRDQIQDLVSQPDREVVVALPRRRDQMLADHLLLAPLQRRLSAGLLVLGVLFDVISAHAVEDEVSLVGHAHNVILAGMGEQATLVDELDEREAGVLLQGCLPFLGAKEHDELDDGRGLAESGEAG